MILYSQQEVAEQLGINYHSLRTWRSRHEDCPQPSGFRGGWTKQDVQRLRRWLKERRTDGD